jgi:hypothetical protein
VVIKTFSPASLAEALSNDYTKPEVIMSKQHFKYFLKYLGEEGLQAQAIVIEEDYISRDYLHDYAAYYAFCFTKYPKFCRRIHFFNTTITDELLNRAILEKDELPETFWDSYLGFIVRKPIPTTVIGFTVLKHYNINIHMPDRNFWGLRNYKVHFFGHEVEVTSLAFQEQDSVLAACATTAIWIMLNKAAINVHTILKTPSEITKDAGNLSPDGSRLFPNKGLSVKQICQAIFNSGLVSEVKPPDYAALDKDGNIIESFVSNLYTKKILNAYEPLGIPIILVIKVPDGDEHGLHAITVSGHRQNPIKAIDVRDEISLVAENIDRIYAHDDQWGPFARVNLLNEGDLKTPWTDEHPKLLPTRVTSIIVPVYPKVRISYEDIEAVVIGLDAMLTLFFDKLIKYDLVWDIKIEYSESFKSDIKKSALDEEEKLKRLTKSFPKYLWIATCYIGIHKVFQFTFDATDVNSGMIGNDLVCYMPIAEIKILYDFLVRNETILKSVSSKRARLHYYDFLLKNLEFLE